MTGEITIKPSERKKSEIAGVLSNGTPRLDADSWTALAKLIGRFEINAALNIITELLKGE
jgi:hypothetical protein